MSSPSPPQRHRLRLVRRLLRAPAALDRPGLQWLLQAMSPAPVLVLVHRGRHSGRVYRTPVEALGLDRERGEAVVAPMLGDTSDWYRNVLAGGLVELRLDGETLAASFRQLGEHDKYAVIAAYRRRHPLYSRIVLRAVVALNGLDEASDDAVVQALPMLRMQPPADPTASPSPLSPAGRRPPASGH